MKVASSLQILASFRVKSGPQQRQQKNNKTNHDRDANYKNEIYLYCHPYPIILPFRAPLTTTPTNNTLLPPHLRLQSSSAWISHISLHPARALWEKESIKGSIAIEIEIERCPTDIRCYLLLSHHLRSQRFHRHLRSPPLHRMLFIIHIDISMQSTHIATMVTSAHPSHGTNLRGGV